MIFGVTHDVDGEPIKRATIGFKLSVGEAPTPERNYPRRLEHFIVAVKTGERGTWQEDKMFTSHLREKYCGQAPFRELDIVLLSDEPEEIFRTEFAWRTQTQLICHGDGRDAARRFHAFPAEDQQKIQSDTPLRANDWIEIPGECGQQCPYLQQRACKPSGDLYFMFPERPVLGSVATLHTSGWESIRRISASLHEIKAAVEQYGGSLKGLRLKLVARPYKATYVDKEQRKSSVQLGFNLEFREQDHRTLLPALIQRSKEFKQVVGEVIDIEALPDEDIGKEFYPNQNQQQEQRAAEDGAQAQQIAEAATRRPKALDKVMQSAAAAPRVDVPEEKTLAQRIAAASTVAELQAVGELAMKATKKEQNAVRELYARRLEALKAAAAPAAQPPAEKKADPPNMPEGWKDQPKPDHPTDII